MPSEAVCSFGDYLTQSTKDYFEKPRDSLCIKKCNDTGLIDKILKTADPLFDLSIVIAKSQDASNEVVGGLNKGREAVKVSRDVLGMFNVFNGVVPALYQNMKQIGALISSFGGSNQPYLLNPSPKKHNDAVVGPLEKSVAILEQAGKAVGAGSFIAGFAICRPIANYEKHINKNIDATASKIGKAFPTVMMVNHIGGVVGSGAGLIFQTMAYKRAEQKITYYEKRPNANNPEVMDLVQIEVTLQKDKKAYNEKMLDNGVGFSQKLLELVVDILNHTNTAVPSWVRIGLALPIGVLSVTKEILKKN